MRRRRTVEPGGGRAGQCAAFHSLAMLRAGKHQRAPGCPALAAVVGLDDSSVRDVPHNFKADGFGSLYPRYLGGAVARGSARQSRGAMLRVAV